MQSLLSDHCGLDARIFCEVIHHCSSQGGICGWNKWWDDFATGRIFTLEMVQFDEFPVTKKTSVTGTYPRPSCQIPLWQQCKLTVDGHDCHATSHSRWQITDRSSPSSRCVVTWPVRAGGLGQATSCITNRRTRPLTSRRINRSSPWYRYQHLLSPPCDRHPTDHWPLPTDHYTDQLSCCLLRVEF